MAQKPKLRLGVNVDHVATVRQARGTVYPSVAEAALLCQQAGAHGITVHLREDRRHIQDHDVIALRRRLAINLNLEMANAPAIVAIALKVKPAEVCVVPEKRQELTTEGGLNVTGQYASLARTARRLGRAGIAVSFFIEPDPRQIRACADLGIPYIELHTGTFCTAADACLLAGKPLDKAARRELDRLVAGAELAHARGLKVNAGHGINLANLPPLLAMPHLDTLNIGHSIVARSIFVGLKDATREMLAAMRPYGRSPA